MSLPVDKALLLVNSAWFRHSDSSIHSLGYFNITNMYLPSVLLIPLNTTRSAGSMSTAEGGMPHLLSMADFSDISHCLFYIFEWGLPRVYHISRVGGTVYLYNSDIPQHLSLLVVQQCNRFTNNYSQRATNVPINSNRFQRASQFPATAERGIVSTGFGIISQSLSHQPHSEIQSNTMYREF